MTPTATYGDVTNEYLALRREAAVVAATHELVWVRGPDAVRFLDGLLSQAVDELAQGGVSRGLLLSPQGKLRATLWILRSDDGVGLIAHRGVGAAVIEDLSRFKIRVDATIDLPVQIDSLIGPHGVDALADIGIEAPRADQWLEVDDGLVVAAPFRGAGPARFLISNTIGEARDGSALVRAGDVAATAIRIEAGAPMVGVDIDERTIPQEAAVVDGAVSFTKGCYLGQELVARIDSRGHVNRHLRGIVVSNAVLPPLGAEVTANGKTVGVITSVGESLDLRAPVALALVRREVELDAEVTLTWDGGEARAAVKALPLIP